jgi:dTDP-4-amino-4,6-dideoxygalactose transaminase
MNRIPFFPMNRVEQDLKNRWQAVFAEVIETGSFIRSNQNLRFQEEWSASCRVDFAAGVANGLDGLVLALKALNVGPGMTVAVPSHTFIATWNAVHLAGATPIGVDVDHNGLIDLDILENMENRPDAVIPVHMHGMMVDMNRLMDWANSKNVMVIEDASQAHLATCDGKFAGTFGNVGVFSLYPSKNLGALGDAGVVISNDFDLIEKIRKLSNYGAEATDKYHHTLIGANSRLDELQAAILRENLRYLRGWNAKRVRLADLYKEKLSNTPKLELLGGNTGSVWHHFPVLVANREEFLKHLNSHAIGFEIHYPRLAAYEFHQALGITSASFPRGELISKSIVSLPISPWHTESEIEHVAEVVNNFSHKFFAN